MKRIVLAALALNSAAIAQAPPPPQRVEGTVAAVTDSQVTITKADGANEAVALLPPASRTVNIVAPTTLEAIQPGSYVATANRSQPDGSGVSIELRVYPPDTPRFNVNAAMDAGGQTMMTNGTVATAVTSGKGREITVDYGGGERRITVPKEIEVIANTPGDFALVRPGLKVSVVTFAAAGERPAIQIFTIAKKDLPAE